MEKKKVLLGMSGGVDSSVSAILLKEQGYEVIGVTMKLQCDSSNFEKDIKDVKEVCNKLNIKHYVFDFTTEFKKFVIDDFINEYLDCKTPNPCIECNKNLKFGALYEKAKEMNVEYIATGHYAKVEYSPKFNRYVIKKSNSLKKDQSYFLYEIDKDVISHIIFPLSEFESKDQIRKIAFDYGFSVASKKDSQEICFIPNDDYVSYLINNSNVKLISGDIISDKNVVLGRHKGLINYTIGQRRGLSISNPKPLYVSKLNKEKNQVIVSEQEGLFSSELIIEKYNILAVDKIDDQMRVKAKIRYLSKEADATLYNMENGNIKVVFDLPQKAITPGQSIVFYIDDVVLGGGKIV